MPFLGVDDLARRAATALHLGSEIAARRLLAQVSRVKRSIPEDAAIEFLNVVRPVSARQDALDDAREVAALQSRTEDAEPVKLEREELDVFDDPDDLAEFDPENRRPQ